MSNNRRTRRQQHKQKNTSTTRIWPILLFLFALVGVVIVGKIYLTAPGGELNAQGLRVSGEGRSDASHVMPPAFFDHPRVEAAYTFAQQIPATLNQLYCWCGCIPHIHRSALECFESMHAANCDICLANAEVAWEMTQEGSTDPAEIQKVLDERYGRGPRL